MLLAVRRVPAEVRKQINQHTRTAADPIWREEIRVGAATRIEQRVLVDTSRVGVTNRNVLLRSGQVGSLRSGTPVNRLAAVAEFGMNAGKTVTQKSRKGTRYTRKLGPVYRTPKRGGGPVYSAVARSIPRVGALWVQTAVRTVLDALDGKQ